MPSDTGLTQHRFERAKENPQEPRITPDDTASCWKKPGPVAGPFNAHLGDGSVVTYYWYRFADQPAMLNADLTDEEHEQVQARVEKLIAPGPKTATTSCRSMLAGSPALTPP